MERGAQAAISGKVCLYGKCVCRFGPTPFYSHDLSLRWVLVFWPPSPTQAGNTRARAMVSSSYYSPSGAGGGQGRGNGAFSSSAAVWHSGQGLTWESGAAVPPSSRCHLPAVCSWASLPSSTGGNVTGCLGQAQAHSED